MRLHDELGGHWALLVPGTGGRACAEAAADRLGPFPVPLTRTDGSDDVWLVRTGAHRAWRGRTDAAGLGRWLDEALHDGKAKR